MEQPPSTPAGDAPSRTTRSGRMPRSKRRAQLLEAAQEVFSTAGYHQASMDDIAERAGVSKPVLYQHFPGKLELYLALLDHHIGDLVARIEQAMAVSSDNKEKVRGAVTTYFDFVSSGTSGYRLVFESDLRNDPQVRERVRRTEDACVAAIAKAISSDTDLPEAASRLLGVGLVGVSIASASAWLDSGDAVSRDDAINLVSALLWRGISAFPIKS
ncbi:TetR family transcriptional regulator [Epidermidibacterium keratini]|uniref:TetR family transcriptional regulator n=1 Tax=Epidermidibacterium keratini TaxID=1891644 RepID=A0A7L4YRR7_9ACTN|nr:TetR/AcrR family transcriptional regulator [Epidermidibacterium keratini]QHC01594.1 TetR family transcriptional regulator [Epidermidibacterium keratini]